MFAYLNLILAIIGILGGWPMLIPITNIVAAGACFAVDRSDAVDAAKSKMRKKMIAARAE